MWMSLLHFHTFTIFLTFFFFFFFFFCLPPFVSLLTLFLVEIFLSWREGFLPHPPPLRDILMDSRQRRMMFFISSFS
ncbi:hypothetical protein K432DRAFT_51502 [Lepidopterella palustris CBS 459.81]|uniref:Uncharacterized protein n=1 Tax=Lepidopterella palustris CBS 459.81 TaxID=1314670 RepID=A0A8E2EA93_9PEZI|nr:hypothetical protein K432DRAFT_51502 [Lepidopterella palustris CBS 459.81]